MTAFTIEDIALGPVPVHTGVTEQLFKLKVGQSFLSTQSYGAAKACIRAAKKRKNNPLVGNFRVMRIGEGVRIGRI